MDNAVEIYKDACIKTVEHPYMTHKVFKTVSEIQFAPFEDAMGIGHAAGFTSILVPGRDPKAKSWKLYHSFYFKCLVARLL